VLLSSGFMPSGDDSARLFDARLLKPARQNQLFETLARCLSAGIAPAVAAGTLLPEVRRDIHVLVADDNAVNLKVASAMVTKLGYDVITAVDGREAVDAVAALHARGQSFGAVLMDVNMPHLDGLQATQQIQQHWGIAAPPIIALTAAASAEDRARCMAAGMDDYLTKPLQVSALANALERWVGSGSRVTAVDAAAAPPVDAPAAPAAGEANVIDFARLEEFREFDDEALSMTREVVDLFVADAPLRIAAIRDAIGSGDAQAVATAAHALKGASSNVGAVAMQAVCSALEADARDAGAVPADAPERAARLDALWTQTHAALQAWLPR
jgi:CheY-like chemotaxis protein/HPt (histidine-containing phosphotransfer) domain-containing protein